MFLFVWLLFVPGIFGEREEFYINNYHVTSNDGILERVKATVFSSTELRLEGLGLWDIYEGAFQYLKIRNLSLADNFLTDLPNFLFWSLRDLEYLSLADNQLQNLRIVFGGLKNLKELDIRNNDITYLHAGSFYGLTKTVKILATGNDFGTISDVHYQSPYTAYLKSCFVKAVVKSLELYQENNDYHTIDECIVRIVPMRSRNMIDLSVRDITGFRKGWYRVEGLNITYLELGMNQISKITPGMLNDLPKQVTTVNLSRNRITSIENGVIFNRNLRELNLRHNRIRRLGNRAFAKMKNCRILLSDNKSPYHDVFVS